MKKLLTLAACLFVLVSCMPADRSDGSSGPIISSTAVSFPTVTLTSTPITAAAPVITPTPENTVTATPSISNLPLIVTAPTTTATVTPSATATATPTSTPYGLPDLTIPYTFHIDYDNTCPWGSPGTITVWVENVGTNHAGPFIAAIFPEETQFAGLLVGEQAPLVYHFSSGPVGSIYAEADTQNQVLESDENNNIMQIMMTPPPPCGTPFSR